MGVGSIKIQTQHFALIADSNFLNIYILIGPQNMYKRKQPEVPLFIGKFYKIIQDPENSDAVGWTSTKDSFSIKNVSKFTEEVLPEHFKHRNFASFIRQLHIYSFKKIRHLEGENVYMNVNFKAGCPYLLKRFKRKNNQGKEEQIEMYRPVGSGCPEPALSRQIEQLMTNQENLQEKCQYFINKNQQVSEERQNFLQRLDREEKEREQKLQEILIYLLAQCNTHTLLNTPTHPQLSIASHQFNSPNIQFIDYRNQYLDNENQKGLRSVEVREPCPSQVIDKPIKEEEELSKLTNMIQEIYSKKEGKTEANYCIQNNQITKKKESNFLDFLQDVQNSRQRELAHAKHRITNDDSHFYSIKEFLNVQIYEQITPSPLFSRHD